MEHLEQTASDSEPSPGAPPDQAPVDRSARRLTRGSGIQGGTPDSVARLSLHPSGRQGKSSILENLPTARGMSLWKYLHLALQLRGICGLGNVGAGHSRGWVSQAARASLVALRTPPGGKARWQRRNSTASSRAAAFRSTWLMHGRLPAQ